MEYFSAATSPLDYPGVKYFLLPNHETSTTIKSGSLRVELNTDGNNNNNNVKGNVNNNNADTNSVGNYSATNFNYSNSNMESNTRKTEVILEPYLPNVEQMVRNEKIHLILTKLKKNPAEVEIKFNFFYSSCRSIPQEIQMEYLSEFSLQCIHSLEAIPSIKDLENYIHELSDSLIECLYWLLIGFKKPKINKLETLDGEPWFTKEIREYTNNEIPIAFKLGNNTPKNDINFIDLCQKMETGFLPVRSSDAFALLFNWRKSGRDRCFNHKFRHAFDFSILQNIWPKSIFGNQARIIFVIEYYRHPTITYVGDIPGPTLSLSLDMNSSDPPGFFLVRNADYARISHILLYKGGISVSFHFKKILSHAYYLYKAVFYCLLGSFIAARILKKANLIRF